MDLYKCMGHDMYIHICLCVPCEEILRNGQLSLADTENCGDPDSINAILRAR